MGSSRGDKKSLVCAVLELDMMTGLQVRTVRDQAFTYVVHLLQVCSIMPCTLVIDVVNENA